MKVLAVAMDIKMGPEHDLSTARVVGGVLNRIAAKEFDYVHVVVPCNTFSQAR